MIEFVTTTHQVASPHGQGLIPQSKPFISLTPFDLRAAMACFPCTERP